MYEGVRLAEILDKSTSCLRHWLWIPGQLNPADWITRTTLSAQDMGAGSLYQTGLACFLNAAAVPEPPPELEVEESLGQRAAALAAVYAKLSRRLASEVLELRGDTPKWKAAGPDKLKVGSLCAFFDQSIGTSSKYRIGTVTEVKTSSDGIIRSAKVSYKVGKTNYTTTRSARCIVVL